MLTKEQYEEINKHREALRMFEKNGEWLGGDEPFYIHQRITGTPMTQCGSCKGQRLIDLINMLKMYEERNM
jgi:hypothetical protein